MKYLSGKLDFDYLSKYVCCNTILQLSFTFFLSFSAVVKAQALCVCLVFDSTGLPDFKGPKYYLPDTPAPMLTGLNSYPFMITVPAVSSSWNIRTGSNNVKHQKNQIVCVRSVLQGNTQFCLSTCTILTT